MIDLSQAPFENPFKKHKIKRSFKGIKSIISYTPKDSKNLIARFKIETYYDENKYSDEFDVLMFLPIPLLHSIARETGFGIKEIFPDFTLKKNLKKDCLTYIALLQKI